MNSAKSGARKEPAIFENPGIALLLLVAGLAVVGLIRGQRLRHEWTQFQHWKLAGMPQAGGTAPTAPTAPSPVVAANPIDARPLPGAGQALARPPRDLSVALRYIAEHNPNDPYTFPLGWYRASNGEGKLVTASFVGDVNHILITGQTDVGKDNLVRNIMLALTTRHGAEKVQLAIVDGKNGLSWNGWHTKAHTAIFARTSDDILPAMQALTKERQRRERILWDAKAEKWEEYTGTDLPLLLVYVSELLLLQAATSKTQLAKWMSEELSSARSSGIRYLVATQNVSNFDTLWRSNIGLFCAGYQSADSADEPNTTLSTKALRELGKRADGQLIGIAPSALPAPSKHAPDGGGAGVFTLVQGREVITVRTTLLPSEQVRFWLTQMPDKSLHTMNLVPTPQAVKHADNPLLEALVTGAPIPIEPERLPVNGNAIIQHSDAEKSSAVIGAESGNGNHTLSVNVTPEQLPLPAEQVPAEDQRKILAAAQSARDRKEVCQAIYGTTQGRPYSRVKAVLDAAGLLLKEPLSA